jgi:hypothetical protein
MEVKKSPYDVKIWTKSYDKHVKPNLSYPQESLGNLFDRAMTKYPDRISCYFMER